MNAWENIKTWELVLPPSRPSAMQLSGIRLATKDIDRDAPVAVLGSTPEFRDLLYESGFKEICLFEKNVGFHGYVSKLRVYSNKEIVIWGDWLETLPHQTGRFAAILSDLTSGNLPYDKREEFYVTIGRALAPNGLFLDKVLTHPCPHLSVNTIFEKYSHLPLNLLHINYFSCEMFFCSELLYETELVDSTKFYSILESRAIVERTKAFLQKTELITPRGCLWWYGKHWDSLRAHYCPSLQCLAIDDDDLGSPYYGRVKHFVFVNK